MVDSNIQPTENSFNLVIAAYSRAGETLTAKLWLDKLHKFLNHDEDVLNTTISSHIDTDGGCRRQGKQNRLESIIAYKHLGKWMENGRHPQSEGIGLFGNKQKTLLEMRGELDIASMSGKVDEALQALEQIKQLAKERKKEDVFPDLFDHAKILTAHSKSGDGDSAMKYLQTIEQSNIIPDIVCYDIILNAYSKRGNADAACEVLETIKASPMLKPSIISYNHVLTTCAKQGNLLAIKKYLEEMEQYDLIPNMVSYTCAIRASSVKADVASALHYFDVLLERKLTPDTICFNLVVAAFSRSNDPQGAKDWLSKMREHGVAPDNIAFKAALNSQPVAAEMFSKTTDDIDAI